MSGIGSQAITRLDLSIGLAGSWRAEVWCAEGTAPTGPQTLTVGGLDFVGTAIRGGTDAPDLPHLVHVGGPGWDAAAGRVAYQLDGGVRLSTVLRDLSARAGEPIELPSPDVTIGRSWCAIATREGEPLRYRDALAALVHGRYVKPWRVDLDGVTRFGERTGGAVDLSIATVIKRDEAAGWARLGADTFADLLPGATFEGNVITRLVINERPGNLQAEVWTRAPNALTSILRAVSSTWPALVYGHPRTYRVGAVATDGRLDLDPPADAAHLPSLQRVEVWGLGGAKVKPAIGSLAVVLFRDANPSRPCVVALQPLEDSTPSEMNIDADDINLGAASARVIRDGDYVSLTSTGPPLNRSIIGLYTGATLGAPVPSKVKA